MLRSWRFVLPVLVAVACAPDPGPPRALPPADEEAVQAVERAYVAAWAANDSQAVMATMASNAVLLPDGMAPIRGDSAIRGYWWPDDGSETRVTSYETSISEVGGSADFAYLRGTGSLDFEWRPNGEEAWQSFSNRSAWLALLRRVPDGTWRMTHRMWHRVDRN